MSLSATIPAGPHPTSSSASVACRATRSRWLNGTLYVNGESIDEPYITNHANYNMEAVTLGENEYFVLGDNRSSTNDSHIIGPLSRDQIKGHVRSSSSPSLSSV